MISTYFATKYCSEPIENIENYQEAISDHTQVWVCHHRAEILPCGTYSSEALKRVGLYWNRPARELIFLRESEHRSLHGRNQREETRQKISSTLKGRVFSDEWRFRISSAKKGRKGRLNPQHSSRPVKMIRTEDGLTKVFPSIHEAERWLREHGFPKANNAHISECCRGLLKHTCNASWSYVDYA